MPDYTIMHFTHVSNLPGILAAGCLAADSLVDRASALRVEAADLEVKAIRKRCKIPVTPFGFVADYVPFYFAPRSPMLFTLAKGGVPGYTDGQDPLIYLVSSVVSVASVGLACLFSDGNCASTVTRFFADLALLDSVVDWEVMYARMWANTPADTDRRRRRMAEFLVHGRVPIACVSGIVVRRETMREQVERTLAASRALVPVWVRPWWYFETA